MNIDIQHRAKKKFGQNFLKDFKYLNEIIQSIPNIFRNERLIEIGVGLGDLTDRLLKQYALKAYEIDKDLCSFIEQKYSSFISSNRFVLINADVLELDDKVGWLDKNEYVLVSNLPYYIASAILIRVLKDPKCRGFIVMTQKEVAQKFCATHNDRNFSALSVITRTFGDPELLFDVPKEAFDPMPKVTSSVFMMRKNLASLEEGFEEMLKVAFSSPRKKLLNNLSNRYDKFILENLFKELNIFDFCRPHQLSTRDYHQIFNKLKVEKNGK